jgi:hypothetical protein
MNALHANCLQLITDKFGFVVNIASLQSELIAVNSLKKMAATRVIACALRSLAEVMISRHIDQMSETSKLCEIVLCILQCLKQYVKGALVDKTLKKN